MELSVYDVDSIAGGYFYECSCGERYTAVAVATRCRKCRSYTQEGYCTSVYDIASQKLVWECPSVVAERERQVRIAAYVKECKKPFTLGDACPGLGEICV